VGVLILNTAFNLSVNALFSPNPQHDYNSPFIDSEGDYTFTQKDSW
jgi:hypothetical protein